jgi:ribosomal protein S12 methylthiotransferase
MIKNRVDIISLGCSKNLVDSERVMAQFASRGFNVFHDSSDVKGEYVVINTCGFIGDAKEESIEMILSLAQAKKRRKIGKLIVMGCLSERYREELKTEIPEVDAYYGKFDWVHLAEDLFQDSINTANQRVVTTPSHYAYVKIAEGCNRTCSYCAIPIITGKYKSRSIESIVDEVKLLVAQGVKEFQLIAQDLTFYGYDLYKTNKLAELVQTLADIEGVEWLRLHYGYPNQFPYELLDVMRNNANVCAYMDVALQHISNNVLSLMRRNVTKDETYAFVRRLREEVPGIHLRTTLLVGHPGETEQDFEELLQFVRDMRFERMGAFAYSDEDGTYSNLNYTDDVPQEVKQERVDRLMELQAQISEEINTQKIGQIFKVIIDREEEDFYVGRTEFDSPDVDGEVLISKDYELCIGDFYQVKITEADMYDLYGDVVYE